jgi:hypothetical protein
MNTKILSLFVIAALVSLVGVVFYSSINANAIIMPKDNGEVNLPEFALGSKETKAAYLAAVEKSYEFSYLPCYCGCGMSEMEHRGKTISKHNSLKECFIKADGSWEDHAAMDCNGCVQTALDAYNQLAKGNSLKEVRDYIDKKYGNGLGTNTPMPA